MQNSGTSSHLWISWGEAGVRRRLGQRGRLGTLLFQLTPWLTLAVIGVHFALLSKQITITPGIQFDLPKAPFIEGSVSGPSIVMLRSGTASQDTATAGLDEDVTLVFFDDIRYRVGTDDEVKLGKDLALFVEKFNAAQVILLADKNVLHGDVMKVVNIARASGVKHVNVAVKPE